MSHYKVSKLLLKAGADVNLGDIVSDALHCTALRHAETVGLLDLACSVPAAIVPACNELPPCSMILPLFMCATPSRCYECY